MNVSGIGLRSAIRFAALANLAFFAVEFAVAPTAGSVSLFADSVDFLEDASVNFLVLLALGWPPPWRARAGMMLAGSILVPSLATLWLAWRKFMSPAPPQALSLSLTGAAAHDVDWGRTHHSFAGPVYAFALESFAARKAGRSPWSLLGEGTLVGRAARRKSQIPAMGKAAFGSPHGDREMA